MRRINIGILALVLLSFGHVARAADYQADVVIYGGTSAAIPAAVQAKSMGKSVVIVSPDKHLGGLTSGGLGWTDSGKKDAVGGLSREFFHRVWKHYQANEAWRWQDKSTFKGKEQSVSRGTITATDDRPTMWVFEPHVAEQIFDGWIAEHDITVHRERWLDRSPGGVTKSGARIESFRTLDGTTYTGKMFLDVTYEGDLMAAAGVDYHVGRESNSTYDEVHNGVQTGVLHHHHYFDTDIDPYVTPGDPASGLLPRISADPPGEFGQGDHRIQAYCFRMCLTNADANRIPFAKPDGYDAGQYELLGRVFDAGWRAQFRKFDPLPNHKTDTNNHGPFSTDNIGMNYDYPDASYERRREIIAEHETYQKGLMFFMANDERVPVEVREAMQKWGLAKDEFTDNGGWPHQLYIREARRMVGQYVMTENDCMDTVQTPDSIGMGSYALDSHNVQRYVKPDGFVQNEGDIGAHPPRPYEIAYGAIVPKKSQCENLLVPVCVSSSHIAFGSIRMEPVFMILGQSAATAACLSIDLDQPVQDLDYAVLQNRLLADRQVLAYQTRGEVRIQQLAGIVVDDRDASFRGKWVSSRASLPHVEGGYHHNANLADDGVDATFNAKLEPGRYEVRLAYSANANRATNVVVTVQHRDGTATTTINQRQKPPIEDTFISLGDFNFADQAAVTVTTSGTNGYVIADAVQFLPIED